MSGESTEFRKPSGAEERLIRALVTRSADLQLPSDWNKRLRVRAMNDGGMGSLRLSTSDNEPTHRELGKIVAELQFTDADGIQVLVSLNTDRDGHLFELDVWKTDYRPLIGIPDQLS